MSEVVRERTTLWGIAAGLLAACGLTLLGIACRHEPHVILYRTAVGSTLIALMTHALILFCRELLAEDED